MCFFVMFAVSLRGLRREDHRQHAEDNCLNETDEEFQQVEQRTARTPAPASR